MPLFSLSKHCWLIISNAFDISIYFTFSCNSKYCLVLIHNNQSIRESKRRVCPPKKIIAEASAFAAPFLGPVPKLFLGLQLIVPILVSAFALRAISVSDLVTKYVYPYVQHIDLHTV